MLDARIQQLRSDVIIDVQQAKVQFVPSYGRVSSGSGPKSAPHEKADIPKSEQTIGKGISKFHSSHRTEKLTQEKKKKLQKVKNVKEKPVAKSISSKSNSQLLGTTYKKISTTAEKTAPSMKKSKGRVRVSDEIRAAMSSIATTTAATTAAETAATSHKVPKRKLNVLNFKKKDSKNRVPGEKGKKPVVVDVQDRHRELPEAKKQQEERLFQQASQLMSSRPEHLQDRSEESAYGDTQACIRSYLQALVFVGYTERAHRFLLSQHRLMGRRKYLNTDIYNILMRVWAKKVRSKTMFVFFHCV